MAAGLARVTCDDGPHLWAPPVRLRDSVKGTILARMTSQRRWITVLAALALVLGPIVMSAGMAAPIAPQSAAMGDDGGSAPMPCCPDSDAATMPTMVCGLTCPAATIVPALVTVGPHSPLRLELSTSAVHRAGLDVPPDPFPPKISH